jgi:predicted secreted hydrolase
VGIKRMIVAVLLGTVLVAQGIEVPRWQQAEPGYNWSFPRDLYAHSEYKTEWWYVTGHLAAVDEADSELAFQLTFFRIGIQEPDSLSTQSAWRADDLVMAHAALMDSKTGEHIFSEVVWRATPFLGGFGDVGDSTLAWCQAPPGTDAQWRLEYQDGEFLLSVEDARQDLKYDLRCRPTQEPVLHGESGYSRKSEDGKAASLYFSQTRMEVSGTVDRKGRAVPVTGESWLDREMFTSTLGEGQKGWDWLSLQLDDGRELMLYRLLAEDGSADYAMGTMVGPDGKVTLLTEKEWQLKPTSYWTSPETEARYPVAWSLDVPGRDVSMDLEAMIPEQENVSKLTGIHYWEGAVRAKERGNQSQTGRGFVEMTGYGKGSRPPV